MLYGVACGYHKACTRLVLIPWLPSRLFKWNAPHTNVQCVMVAPTHLLRRYHLLHPTYIGYRIKQLQRAYALRVLLVLVDVEEVVHPLAAITKQAALNDVTLVCAWSTQVGSTAKV